MALTWALLIKGVTFLGRRMDGEGFLGVWATGKWFKKRKEKEK